MKLAWLVLLCWLVLLGCSTPTVESRKKERPAEYSALPDEQKRLVDKGQIKVGMNSDAVYLAWGPPAEILENESESGRVTSWIYYGQWLEETRFWTYREVARDGTTFLERYVDRDYYPRSYIRAEIYFQNGKVTRWGTLPRPPY